MLPSPPVKIAGSNILVTGASSGIGAELAPQLAQAGATVGIVARRAERLEQVLERCRAHAPGSRMWAADLGDLDRAEQVALEAWDAFGHLDCLVNNAAIPKRTPLTRLTPADVTHVMDVDFHSPVRMGMAVLPRMLERGSGEIVNVSSLGGRLGIAHEAAYCAAKFALCGWTEVMEVDLHGTGIAAKLVLPGPIETEIWDLRQRPCALRRPVRARGRLRGRDRAGDRGGRLRVLRATGHAGRLRQPARHRGRQDPGSRRVPLHGRRDGEGREELTPAYRAPGGAGAQVLANPVEELVVVLAGGGAFRLRLRLRLL